MNEYEDIIKQVQKKIIAYQNKYDTQCLRFYYRGQANNEWELIPKIMRPEYAHICEASIMEQAHWNRKLSIVENIAQMQHYGTPTRFLDFTTDIDVALYFTCREEKDKDGLFYIFTYDERELSYIDSIIISELTCLKQEISLLDFSNQLLDKYPQYRCKYANIREFGMNILSWIDHGFMITPSDDEREKLKDINPRLYNQRGAFYVFGNRTKAPVKCASTLEVPSCVILPKIMDKCQICKLFLRYHILTVTVPKNTKDNILNYLHEKGVNESFVFPDMK